MALQVDLAYYLPAHKDCIYALEKNDETTFYTGGGDGMLILWDLAKCDTATVLARTEGSIYVIKKIGETLLFVATNRGNLYLINTIDKLIVAETNIKNGIFDAIVLDDKIFVTQTNGLVSTILLPTLEVLHSQKICSGSIRKIISKSNTEFIIGSSDNSITLINNQLETVWKKELAHADTVFALCMPKPNILISGGKDAYLRRWVINYDGIDIQNEVPAHLFAVNDVVANIDGSMIYSASRDKSIKIWDSETLLLKKVIDRQKIPKASSHSVNRILLLKDYLISVGDDRVVRGYKINEQKLD